MALSWSYGFEAGSGSSLSAELGSEYSATAWAYVYWETDHHSHATIPSGGYSWKNINYFNFTIDRQEQIATVGSDFIVSWAYKQQDTGRAAAPLIITRSAAADDVAGMWKVVHSGSGEVGLVHYDGSTWQTVATSVLALTSGSWMTIALKITKTGTTHAAEVFVGGVSYCSGSLVHSATPGQVDGFKFQANQALSGSHHTWTDDIRVYSDVAADLTAAKSEGFVCGRMVDADSIDGAFSPSAGTDLFSALEAGGSADWAKYADTTTDPDTMRLSLDNSGGTGGTIEGVIVHCIADADASIPNITLGMAESSVATPVNGAARDCQVKKTTTSAILTSDGSTAWSYAAFDAANVVIKASS